MELKGYTNIPDWMLSLDLDVYETIILAVIYGFSQDGDSTFSGSQNYLAKKAKCSRSKVARTLPKLVSMGLLDKIDKDVRGVKLCEYRVCPSAMGCSQETQGGYVCETHNNIDIENIDISIEREKGRRPKFHKPTLDEVTDYCLQRNNGIDPEEFFAFYESKGWVVGKSPMKSWEAAIRTWEKKREKEVPQRKRERKESVFEHNLKVMDEMYGTNLHQQGYGGNGNGK